MTSEDHHGDRPVRPGRATVRVTAGDTIYDEGFTMVPNLILRYARELSLDPVDQAIITQLLGFIWRGTTAFPSIATLADLVGIGERQLQRRLSRLRLMGYIRMDTGGGRQRNTYNLAPLFEKVRGLHAVGALSGKTTGVTSDTGDVSDTAAVSSASPEEYSFKKTQELPSGSGAPGSTLSGKSKSRGDGDGETQKAAARRLTDRLRALGDDRGRNLWPLVYRAVTKHGARAVEAAVAVAEERRPVDPFSFAMGVLRNGDGPGPPPPKIVETKGGWVRLDDGRWLPKHEAGRLGAEAQA